MCDKGVINNVKISKRRENSPKARTVVSIGLTPIAPEYNLTDQYKLGKNKIINMNGLTFLIKANFMFVNFNNIL